MTILCNRLTPLHVIPHQWFQVGVISYFLGEAHLWCTRAFDLSENAGWGGLLCYNLRSIVLSNTLHLPVRVTSHMAWVKQWYGCYKQGPYREVTVGTWLVVHVDLTMRLKLACKTKSISRWTCDVLSYGRRMQELVRQVLKATTPVSTMIMPSVVAWTAHRSTVPEWRENALRSSVDVCSCKELTSTSRV